MDAPVSIDEPDDALVVHLRHFVHKTRVQILDLFDAREAETSHDDIDLLLRDAVLNHRKPEGLHRNDKIS